MICSYKRTRPTIVMEYEIPDGRKFMYVDGRHTGVVFQRRGRDAVIVSAPTSQYKIGHTHYTDLGDKAYTWKVRLLK